MDLLGIPGNGGPGHEGTAPLDIEEMAQQAVADLEAGNEEPIPMETEPTMETPSPVKIPFEPTRPEVVSQTESSLTVSNNVLAPVTIAFVPPPPPTDPTATTPDASGLATPASGKKDRKRKTARTVRRVLVAKKELEAATQTMTGLRDIAKVLDPEDAAFLAEKYWVFTQVQLSWLLESVSPPKETEKKGEEKEGSAVAESNAAAPSSDGAGDAVAEKQIQEGETGDSKQPPDWEGVAAPEIADPSVEPATAVTETGVKAATWQTRLDLLLANMATCLKFDSAKVVTAEVHPDGNEATKEISIASREDAEQRLNEWGEKLKTIEGRPFQVEEGSFPLSGPMQFLLPKGFKNFLESIDQKTIYGFLSLKKTETGALCELYALWRHTCTLSRVTAPAVVRYFLGIHARLEGAITAVPPCDDKQKKWMNNTIVVMTGAALEFLAEDRGIYTVRDFVDARTKELSIQLAEWRERKKLEPLKGSGKVAMISGWKAVAKEIIVMESGFGEVVPNLKLLASSDLILDEDPRPKRVRMAEKAAGTPAKKAGSTTPAAATPRTPASAGESPHFGSGRSSKGSKSEYDLHSKLFLEQMLGIVVTQFLALASIHTAAQLFDVESKSDETILQAMIDSEEAKDQESASRILSAWANKLKAKLAESSAKKKGRPQGKAINPEVLKDASDPYDLMSDVTKKFLATMEIYTAEQFLSTRTTEIAAEFVKFRKNNGMSELKGLGSIASVSGWKANCRRFARAMGWDDTAVLEPPENKGNGGTPRRPVPMKAAIIQQFETPFNPTSTATHSDVLFGKSRRMFAVQGDSDSPIQFRFDVSLRNDASGVGMDMFLTYKGSGPSLRPASLSRITVLTDSGDVASKDVPLLVDTTLTKSGGDGVDARSPFLTNGEGGGVIDLHKYGVRPLKEQNISNLETALEQFFLGQQIQHISQPEATAGEGAFNVGVRRTDVDKCQYLATVGSPLQAGQTMALVFPTVNEFLAKPPSSETGTYIDRNLLVGSLFLASKSDLRRVLKFIGEEIPPALQFDSASLSWEDVAKLKTACMKKQRIDWIARRLLAQLPLDEAASAKGKFFLKFKDVLKTPAFKSLSDEDYGDVVKGLQSELILAFMSVIEEDNILGMCSRASWCPFGTEIFDQVVALVIHHAIPSRRDNSTDLNALLSSVLQRARDLSVDSSDLSKLAFRGSPLDNEDKTERQLIVYLVQPDAMDTSEPGESQPKQYEAASLESGKTPDASFYHDYLVKIAVKAFSIFGKVIDGSDFAAEKILESINLGKMITPEARASIAGPWRMPINLPVAPVADVQPQTEQFFLGIVWPVLREFGWRIEVNDFPAGRTFVAPKWKGDQQKLGKLARLAKQHRDRRRHALAREANQLGFGAVSKLTKRLFVVAGGMDKSGEKLGKPAPVRKITTVRKICEKYLGSIKIPLGEEDTESFSRAKEIIEIVIDCFDALAPGIQSAEVNGRASEKYGGDVFMEFLLSLPALLGGSGVELQEINDSLELVHELTNYMTYNSTDLFPANMQPSPETYMTKGKQVPSMLISRLQHKKISEEKKSAYDELTEVLWEEDAQGLTDFVVNVMRQTLACRATEADVARKFRRIHVGYPGVVCRHCMGEGGEGRYFFTTIESLTTLSTVFEKHVLKCAFVPADVKKSVTEARLKHTEQRKALPNGVQQAYFNKLWDRLRSMKIAGTSSSSAVPLILGAQSSLGERPMVDEAPAGMAATDEKMAFADSLGVLDYVRTSAPWKGTKEIEEVLNQYYNCLDYGGRIYMTKSMPDHFSPAWLLAKVVPRRTRKTTNKRSTVG